MNDYNKDDHTNREWCEEHGEDYNKMNGIINRNPPARLDEEPDWHKKQREETNLFTNTRGN